MPAFLRAIDNLSIRKKFIWLYVLCVIFPLVITQGFVLNATTSEIRAREQQNTEMSLNRARTSIEYQFSSTLALANAIATDSQIANLVTRQYVHPTAYYVQYFDWLRPKLTSYLSSYAQQVDTIELYVENQTILSGGMVMRLTNNERAAAWYQASHGQLTGRITGYGQRSISGGIRPQISVVRSLDSSTNSTEQLVKINLSMAPIHRSLYQEREYMRLYLVNASGVILSHSDSYSDPGTDALSTQLPERYDLDVPVGIGSSLSGWHLIAVVNQAAMHQSILSTVLASLLVAALVSALAALAAVLIAESFLKRSRNLLNHMDAVGKGQFGTIDGDSGEDEIGELIHHYNDMSGQLERLIDDVYQLGAQKKSLELERVRAELKYLQAQIDPHFLFNTLNALLVVSTKNGYTQITPVIRSLAKILRRMADTSDDLVPIEVELDFTRMYLDIMRFRFGDKLGYDIRVEPELFEVPLPQMSIQSLAENACKHGIEHSTSGEGRILIEARADGDHVRVTVTDNGVGIDGARLREIRDELIGNRELTGSVGLTNIHRRLALYYGDAATLEIQSERGAGTAVSMCIPRNLPPRGGEHDVPGAFGG